MSAPLAVTEVTPQYWRATFHNPPINMFNPDLVAGLRVLIERIESDPELRVIVFDSADPDFFVNHVDLTRVGEPDPAPVGPTGLPTFQDYTVRLANAPVVSIAAVRGRAQAAGNEYALAADIRFASREKARFGQFEVAGAALPGFGGIERLHSLLGRARALEAVLGSDDFDADTAERYGWINRAVPDAELDAFVDRFARRIASFDRDSVVSAKRRLNSLGGIPSVDDLAHSLQEFRRLISRPSAQQRIQGLIARGLQTTGELELNLGAGVGDDPVRASAAR
jgi:enoyl-CoA hydratase/carnithine racemase